MTIRLSLKTALFGLTALTLGATGALADQLADIKAAGKITTATDMHYAPFDMLNNGTYEGMTKDLFDEVSKEIGVEPVYQDIPWTAELPGRLRISDGSSSAQPTAAVPRRPSGAATARSAIGSSLLRGPGRCRSSSSRA